MVTRWAPIAASTAAGSGIQNRQKATKAWPACPQCPRLIGESPLEERQLDVAEVQDALVLVGVVAPVHRHVGHAGTHHAQVADEAGRIVAAEHRRVAAGAMSAREQRVGDAARQRPRCAVEQAPAFPAHAHVVGVEERAPLEQVGQRHQDSPVTGCG